AGFRRPASHRASRAGMGAQAFDARRLTFANSSIPMRLDCGPIDARLGRNGGGGHYSLLLASGPARAGPPPLANRGARHHAAADTMPRRHFGQVYPVAAGGKSYSGPT